MFLVFVLLQSSLSGIVYITPDLRSGIGGAGMTLCFDKWPGEKSEGPCGPHGLLWGSRPETVACSLVGSDVLEQLKLAGDRTWGKGAVSSEGS